MTRAEAIALRPWKTGNYIVNAIVAAGLACCAFLGPWLGAKVRLNAWEAVAVLVLCAAILFQSITRLAFPVAAAQRSEALSARTRYALQLFGNCLSIPGFLLWGYSLLSNGPHHRDLGLLGVTMVAAQQAIVDFTGARFPFFGRPQAQRQPA